MLRRTAVLLFAALSPAHPSLTSVFADEVLVAAPSSPSPATATPTATVTPGSVPGGETTTPGPSATVAVTATVPPPTPTATPTAPPPMPTATPTAQPASVIPSENFYWIGTARVTMYTCAELGGCNYTASGLRPYEGIVAVDPRLIPLGATVWVDGLGIFLAADTGSLIYGNRLDIYVNDYNRAINWGVQELRAAAYIPP
jgi:3D (Asp-Asp-Asp) domain-containing protein